MKSATVITAYTHASRRDAMRETSEAFAAIDLPIEHIQVQVDEPRPANNRRNAWAALKRTLEHVIPKRGVDTIGVLLIEDDIIPAATLPAWLAHLERINEPATLYLPNGVTRFTPPRLEAVAAGRRKARKSELVPIDPEALRGWWGAQAVWLPVAFAKRLVDDLRMQAFEHAIGPWDHALRLNLREANLTLLVAIPNVVQHRALANLVVPTKRRHASLLYDESAPAPAEPQPRVKPGKHLEERHAAGT